MKQMDERLDFCSERGDLGDKRWRVRWSGGQGVGWSGGQGSANGQLGSCPILETDSKVAILLFLTDFR